MHAQLVEILLLCRGSSQMPLLSHLPIRDTLLWTAAPSALLCLRHIFHPRHLLRTGAGHLLAIPQRPGPRHASQTLRRERMQQALTPADRTVGSRRHGCFSHTQGFPSWGKPPWALLRSTERAVGKATSPGLQEGQCSGCNQGSGKVTFPVAVTGEQIPGRL